jgi:hypothetical protein
MDLAKSLQTEKMLGGHCSANRKWSPFERACGQGGGLIPLRPLEPDPRSNSSFIMVIAEHQFL